MNIHSCFINAYLYSQLSLLPLFISQNRESSALNEHWSVMQYCSPPSLSRRPSCLAHACSLGASIQQQRHWVQFTSKSQLKWQWTAEKVFTSFLNNSTHLTKGNRSFAWPATHRARRHSQSVKAFTNFKGKLNRPVIWELLPSCFTYLSN